MIRQKKNKAYLQKSSFQPENFEYGDQNAAKKDKDKGQHIFQEGILNKFYKININNQSALSYASKGRRRQPVQLKRPMLIVNGQNIHKQIQNKQNVFEDSFMRAESQSKILLMQTTGNAMLSFKSYKRKQQESTKYKRPFSAAILSCRSSMKVDNLDNSLSRVLQELNRNDQNKNKQKISTSQALVLFSKVIRSNENTSRQLFHRRIKHGPSERYKSVSVLANKVKIQPKDNKQKQRLDFKNYLKKFKLIGTSKKGVSKPKQDDFHIQGWDTNEADLF